VFHYPEEHSPARLLVRVDENTFVAYEQQCTHLTCPVVPQVAQGELHCPCHEGVFDLLTGRPLSGPPRRPLARVTLAVREGVVYATGIEERSV
jgi:Rieske Fe-S protein